MALELALLSFVVFVVVSFLVDVDDIVSSVDGDGLGDGDGDGDVDGDELGDGDGDVDSDGLGDGDGAAVVVVVVAAFASTAIFFFTKLTRSFGISFFFHVRLPGNSKLYFPVPARIQYPKQRG